MCALREAGFTLSQISERVIEECLADGRHPANDNITLLIVDLGAYFTESAPLLEEDNAKTTPIQRLRLRQLTSEAGQTESAIFCQSSDKSPSRAPSSRKASYIERCVPDLPLDAESPPSKSAEMSSNSQDSCHARSVQNSVYAFFGDSPESAVRITSPAQLQPFRGYKRLEGSLVVIKCEGDLTLRSEKR